MSELRFNPMLGTWTMVASHRQNRPQMPKNWCPFCPGSGKVPESYDVHKYDNDFPALSASPPEPDPVGSDFYKAVPAYGACEVILYSSDHTKTLHELPVPHIRKLVDLWVDRVADLSSRPTSKYVMPFENRGEEIGVTMPHPHGQIYAYSWIPQKIEVELQNAKKHHDATGECLVCRMNREEAEFGERIVFENESFYAYIPFFTDYPYGVFVTAKAHRPRITDLTDAEKTDLADILKVVTGTFDRIFNRPFPYMMAIHQNPVNSPEWKEAEGYYHFHIEFYTPLRAKRLIKYYATSETGAWAAANVAAVEAKAAEVRNAKLAYLADEDRPRFLKEFKAEFFKRYGKGDVALFSSPARINVIGEHIDYNGGKVFPAAIDRFLYLAVRKRADSKIVYDDLRFPGRMEFNLGDDFRYVKENGYANYLNGIVKLLRDGGHQVDRGFEILMFSNIPAGGGVSSSAALEVGFAWALKELFGLNLDRVEAAKLGQRSEHEFMNVKCGIMDQFSVAMGKKDQAMLLDTSNLEYRYVPLELGEYWIVVMNTNKKRELADSKYNERLGECMAGLAELKKHAKIDALCELSSEAFAPLASKIADETIRRRVRHCVTENERVREAVAALEAGNLARLGELLAASHVSLRDDYEVTGLELDTLFEEARKAEGCIGARMTGAGFGGCAIALVKKGAVKGFIEKVGAAYREKTSLEADFFACECGDGAMRIE